MSRIYLDHAATTPVRPQAMSAMREGFERWANPSSPHAEGRAARFIAERLSPGDLVLATWRWDGHPDHEATGRAAAAACARHGVRLAEYPVWAWHWAGPEDARLPWSSMLRLRSDEESIRAKSEALLAFGSQVEHDGDTPPILPPHVLERCIALPETFIPSAPARGQHARSGRSAASAGGCAA